MEPADTAGVHSIGEPSHSGFHENVQRPSAVTCHAYELAVRSKFDSLPAAVSDLGQHLAQVHGVVHLHTAGFRAGLGIEAHPREDRSGGFLAVDTCASFDSAHHCYSSSEEYTTVLCKPTFSSAIFAEGSAGKYSDAFVNTVVFQNAGAPDVELSQTNRAKMTQG